MWDTEKSARAVIILAFMALLLTFWIQKAFAAPFGDLSLEQECMVMVEVPVLALNKRTLLHR
jgi:hypothetical protein